MSQQIVPGLRCPLGEGRGFLAHMQLRHEHLTAETSRVATGQVRAFEQGKDVIAFEVRLFSEPVAEDRPVLPQLEDGGTIVLDA